VVFAHAPTDPLIEVNVTGRLGLSRTVTAAEAAGPRLVTVTAHVIGSRPSTAVALTRCFTVRSAVGDTIAGGTTGIACSTAGTETTSAADGLDEPAKSALPG
jgi:hypothetical protein